MQYDDDKDPGTAALAAAAGLARQVEAVTRDVAAMKQGLRHSASTTSVRRLEETVTSLGNTVASFEDMLTRLTAKPVGAGSSAEAAREVEPVRSWLRLPADRSAVEAVLSELLPWMEATYLRYATAREELPPCWLWHPEIVEELLWLMDAWTLAYEGPEASTKLVGDWHDRQRPGVTRRIGEYAPSCDVLKHRDEADQRAVTVPLAADADPFVAWWAAGRDRTGPAPSAAQIKAGRRGGLAAVPETAGGQR
ncbi:hypothetical protein [Kribbella italica]|uniref:DUF4913 domain-containing protein n=1 Tax=Kribbella italica TaxID=1540520 RepID=A0A7W9JEB4_9ACTN|nr:hypothetical protein [Kribbella italica]MBB5840192.1 hypothetical protein [Kribbella italica]